MGIQFVQIPEIQAFGTEVGQIMSALVAGDINVDKALERAQKVTERIMRRAGK